MSLRFVASLEGVEYVLSGMNEVSQIVDNLSLDYGELTEMEISYMNNIVEYIKRNSKIGCTQCHYCEKVCPKHIPISSIFNFCETDSKNHTGGMYDRICAGKGKASDCLKCGKCEAVCSQRIMIRSILSDIEKEYEPRDRNIQLKEFIKTKFGYKNYVMLRDLYTRLFGKK